MSCIKVNEICPEYDFDVTGVSYVGQPQDGTMMFISRKVDYLLENLDGKHNCLIFAEEGINVPEGFKKSNCFVFTKNPQFDYAKQATRLFEQIRQQEILWGYKLTKDGYYIGHNVHIGEHAYIEPNCLIGHNVVIGDYATVLSGAVIKHAIIGDYFVCNENAVIGDYSFTMAIDENGDKYRIPCLGGVSIGNHVEIGACDDVAAGECGDTVIEDYVKIDALVHLGHAAHIYKNSEITAGGIIAGHVEMGPNAYMGVNSGIRNRIKLGKNTVIGMGANVVGSVPDGITVVGNPAKDISKRFWRV